MHLKSLRPLWALPLLLSLACKDPETVSVQGREQKLQAKMAEMQEKLADYGLRPARRSVSVAREAQPAAPASTASSPPSPIRSSVESRTTPNSIALQILSAATVMSIYGRFSFHPYGRILSD